MGAFGFAVPWILATLLFLPALYWLLRLTPPQPQRIWFPPLKLLQANRQEETPQSSPLWLILLRILLTLILIIGFAQPVLHSDPVVSLSSHPLVLMIDDGWTAAPDWETRKAQAKNIIDRAQTAALPVMLVSTQGVNNQALRFTDAKAAASQLSGMEPQPYLAKRMPLLAQLKQKLVQRDAAQLVWISDGVAGDDGAVFATALQNFQTRTPIVLSSPEQNLRAITAAENKSDALEVKIIQLDTRASSEGAIRALDAQGRLVGSGPFMFKNESKSTKALITLPTHLRNEVFRIEVVQEKHAGAVHLLDERWRRKTVGLYSGTAQNIEQPLLSPSFLLGEAMQGFAEVSKAKGSLAESLQTFFRDRVGVIILSDVGALPQDVHEALTKWLNEGGVLIRFASSAIVEEDDSFFPVKLRPAIRSLGGQLSWEKEQKLGKASGPFAGLDVPDDVTISKQILAEAAPDLQKKTWLELEDGTPLVTAEGRGRGHVVFIHINADPNWSNLSLSGVLLEILQRLISLSTYAPGEQTAHLKTWSSDQVLKPWRSLNAFGALISPPSSAQGLSAEEFSRVTPDSEHPPGLYGSENAFHALNTLKNDDRLEPLEFNSDGWQHSFFSERLDDALAIYFFVAALLLFLVDMFFSFLLLARTFSWRSKRASALLFVAFSLMPQLANAQNSNVAAEERALTASANSTRLAYIKTGLSEVDDVAYAGLKGLSEVLRQRTAVETDEPAALDLAKDEIVFYPMIYWPINAGMNMPDVTALAKAESYMKNGGTILFDTRDRGESSITDSDGASPAQLFLRNMLDKMNVPQVEAVPSDHVLTKAFYIVEGFPGRFEDGPLWVERSSPNADDAKRPVRLADGVSSILITSNDLAGAWAVDETGASLLPLYGSNPRQRELSYRGGINIVVYLLTGNYKADQVHVPDLLKRLGQ